MLWHSMGKRFCIIDAYLFLAEPYLSIWEDMGRQSLPLVVSLRWNHVAVQLALPWVEWCTLRNCKAGFPK